MIGLVFIGASKYIVIQISTIQDPTQSENIANNRQQPINLYSSVIIMRFAKKKSDKIKAIAPIHRLPVWNCPPVSRIRARKTVDSIQFVVTSIVISIERRITFPSSNIHISQSIQSLIGLRPCFSIIYILNVTYVLVNLSVISLHVSFPYQLINIR